MQLCTQLEVMILHVVLHLEVEIFPRRMEEGEEPRFKDG
jgi:hypothetical protein